MMLRIVGCSLLAIFFLLGCSPIEDDQEKAASTATVIEPIATGSISSSDGKPVGLASIVKLENSLALNLSLSNMEGGEKALHLHTTGTCDGPDFKTAGGHLNPTSVTHGKFSETGPHLGDFPNITIAEDGLAEVSIPITGAAEEILAHLFDEDGTAVMLHSGPDDYKTDPAGAAGPRVACAVLKRV